MSWALIFCQFNESFVRHEYLTSLAKLLDLEVENRGTESRIVKQTVRVLWDYKCVSLTALSTFVMQLEAQSTACKCPSVTRRFKGQGRLQAVTVLLCFLENQSQSR